MNTLKIRTIKKEGAISRGRTTLKYAGPFAHACAPTLASHCYTWHLPTSHTSFERTYARRTLQQDTKTAFLSHLRTFYWLSTIVTPDIRSLDFIPFSEWRPRDDSSLPQYTAKKRKTPMHAPSSCENQNARCIFVFEVRRGAYRGLDQNTHQFDSISLLHPYSHSSLRHNWKKIPTTITTPTDQSTFTVVSAA